LGITFLAAAITAFDRVSSSGPSITVM
jgi:hypothetical protein